MQIFIVKKQMARVEIGVREWVNIRSNLNTLSNVFLIKFTLARLVNKLSILLKSECPWLCSLNSTIWSCPVTVQYSLDILYFSFGFCIFRTISTFLPYLQLNIRIYIYIYIYIYCRQTQQTFNNIIHKCYIFSFLRIILGH